MFGLTQILREKTLWELLVDSHTYVFSFLSYLTCLFAYLRTKFYPSPCGYWHVCFAHEPIDVGEGVLEKSKKITDAWFSISQTATQEYRGHISFCIKSVKSNNESVLIRTSADEIISLEKKGIFFPRHWEIEARGLQDIDTEDKNSSSPNQMGSDFKKRQELCERVYYIKGKVLNKNKIKLQCDIADRNLRLVGNLQRR